MAFSQISPCGIQATLSDLAISQSLADPLPESTAPVPWDIPVRAIVFLNDHYPDPTQSIPSSINDAGIDAQLAQMSSSISVAPYVFNFVRCEPVIYITADELHKGDINAKEFIYADDILNVYLFNSGQNPQADFPWFDDHTISLPQNASNLSDGSFLHELGHSVGLFHSHEVGANYVVPVVPGQIDHPYANMGRELVIRDILPLNDDRPFKIPNAGDAGDQVWDTPPGCDANPNRAAAYPSSATIAGCLDNDPNTPCINGCLDGDPSTPCANGCLVNTNTCTYIGDYRDYNYDLVTDPNGVLVQNYMSYFGDCRDKFTLGQAEKVYLALFNGWGNLISDLCGTHQDRVEIRGTSSGVNYVAMTITNELDNKYTKTMTEADGDFFGRLFESQSSNPRNQVTADVRRIKQHDIREYDDGWTNYVNVFDLLTIQRHLLGTRIMDGYSILAADANKSNSLTPSDIVELRKLILGIYPNGLPAYVQPYRFVPETVTLTSNGQLQDDFDGGGTWQNSDNPFNTIDQVTGAQVSALDYCEPHYVITMFHNADRNGFDAVKIGDAHSDWQQSPPPNDPCADRVILSVPNVPIEEEEEIYLLLKGTGINDISAFQIGLELGGENFELLEVNGEGLPFFDEESSVAGGITEEGDNLNLIWFAEDLEPINRSEEETLLSIHLRSKKSVDDLSNVIKILNTTSFQSKFFKTDGDCSGEVIITIVKTEIERSIEEALQLNGSLQLSSYPNPASESVTISVSNASIEQEAKIQFFAKNGQLLLAKDIHLNRGISSFVFPEYKTFPVGEIQVVLWLGDSDRQISLTSIKQ